jgi:hypothetical protein
MTNKKRQIKVPYLEKFMMPPRFDSDPSKASENEQSKKDFALMIDKMNKQEQEYNSSINPSINLTSDISTSTKESILLTNQFKQNSQTKLSSDISMTPPEQKSQTKLSSNISTNNNQSLEQIDFNPFYIVISLIIFVIVIFLIYYFYNIRRPKSN